MHNHADAAPTSTGLGPPGARRPQDAGMLLAAAYDDLCLLAVDLMRNERRGHALVPAGLVHEAAIRMLRPESLPVVRGRDWFFGVMATTMRRVLVEHARARQALRRGSGHRRVALDGVPDAAHAGGPDGDHLALGDALGRLESVNRRQFDVVTLRFFHGLDTAEVAQRLGVSVSTVERDWRGARAWLRHRLADVELLH